MRVLGPKPKLMRSVAPTKRSKAGPRLPVARLHVALTGTPGVGKTTVATEARRAGWEVVDVKAWAHETACVVAYDARDEADVVDVAALAKHMPKKGRILFEGHLAHLLPVQAAWVIRLDPQVLRARLKARGYSIEKVRENLEAEALDIVLQEALDNVPVVVQRDGTRRTPGELFKAFAESGFASAKGHDLEAVDWSKRLPIVATGRRAPATTAGSGPSASAKPSSRLPSSASSASSSARPPSSSRRPVKLR